MSKHGFWVLTNQSQGKPCFDIDGIIDLKLSDRGAGATKQEAEKAFEKRDIVTEYDIEKVLDKIITLLSKKPIHNVNYLYIYSFVWRTKMVWLIVHKICTFKAINKPINITTGWVLWGDCNK